MGGGDKKVTRTRITLRELRSLLAAQAPVVDIPPGEAKAGDLVTIEGLDGHQFLSTDGEVLLARPDLNAARRKPVPTKAERVVAIIRRSSEGDFVIVESLATPRLGRIESIEHVGPHGEPSYVVRTLLEGRRWADARSRFHAGDLWPVSAEAVLGLLAKMDLPDPPTIPGKAGAAQAAPHMSGSIVALRGVKDPSSLAAAPELSGPPMPLGALAGEFARTRFPGPLRRYQTMALEAFDKSLSSGRRRAYLVMPPGAGKTLVGLEIARRLGHRCSV